MSEESLTLKTDPVIADLLNWLKENLPSDVNEDILFKKVLCIQKFFEKLMALSFEEFYNFININCKNTYPTLEEAINERLDTLQKFIKQNELKSKKSIQLAEANEKLALVKKRHKCVTSIKVDGGIELMKRFEHLIPKR